MRRLYTTELSRRSFIWTPNPSDAASTVNITDNTSADQKMRAVQGFDRASQILGPARCGQATSRRPVPAACLRVLQMSCNAGDSPLPSLSRQGRRAQPTGDLKGLSNDRPVSVTEKRSMTKVGLELQPAHACDWVTVQDIIMIQQPFSSWRQELPAQTQLPALLMLQ